jgi:hypothetical protein
MSILSKEKIPQHLKRLEWKHTYLEVKMTNEKIHSYVVFI